MTPPLRRPLHILVPHFASVSPFYADAMANQAMPHLQAWLAGAQLVEAEPLTEGAEALYNAPHERWLALRAGIAPRDSSLPLAALNEPAEGAHGWLQLCHWQVGRTDMSLSPSSSLTLTAQEDAALFAAVAPLLIEDGFALEMDAAHPGRWRVTHPGLSSLRCASPQRAQGRNVRNWQPQGEFAPVWRRIANELQMLLYTHPVNEAREANGQPTANSVWLWACGSQSAVSPCYFSSTDLSKSLYRFIFCSDESLPELVIASEHSAALLSEDWPSFAQHLNALDAQLQTHLQHPNLQLTLCGERRWVTLAAAPQGVFKRWFGGLTRPSHPPLSASLPEL